jgi:formylglycine-generating enzyme required for sulfatase activity
VKLAIRRDVDSDELNDKPTPTPQFHIARYPVTVAQFRAYVESSRLKSPRLAWTGGAGNRPVTEVSWSEAKSYCHWLTRVLLETPSLASSPIVALIRDQGWVIDLPNEPEWEKAARGGAVGQVFSWGDLPDPQRANFAATGLRTTSAVGCFPGNGYGLHDMLGNVWEWTRSRWDTYPYPMNDPKREPTTGGEADPWVVRGGSWFNDPGFARCAIRGRFLPGDRGDDLGFRVVLRSSPVG